MIEVTCPSCGKSLQIEDKYRGQAGKCNGCGGAISVPYPHGMNPVPKWKMGCLYAFLAFAGVSCIAGYLAPKPPQAPRDIKAPAAAPAPQPTPALAPKLPPAPKTFEVLLTEAIGFRNRDKVPPLHVEESGSHLKITFPLNDNLTDSFRVHGAQEDILEALEVAHKERPGSDVTILCTFSMVDLYGNSKEDTVVKALYSTQTIGRINFENLLNIVENAWLIADSATIHEEFRGSKDLPIAPEKSPSAIEDIPPIQATTEDQTLVYVAPTGKKYHKQDCRTLKNGSTGVSLPDAKTRGYTACKVCGG